MCNQQQFCILIQDEVLRAALSLYMGDMELPLPTPEEILICNECTTCEEVWQFQLSKRAVNMCAIDSHFHHKSLYCFNLLHR